MKKTVRSPSPSSVSSRASSVRPEDDMSAGAPDLSMRTTALHGTIFMWPKRWLLLTGGIQNRRHKHVAASLIYGLDGPINIEVSGRWHSVAGAIVAPEVEQALDSSTGRALVVHMDPDEMTWRHLVTVLGGAEFMPLAKGQLDIQTLEDAVHAVDIHAAARWLDTLAFEQADSTALDARVVTVCDWLRESLPERIELAELATLVSLSSSRLTHLFSQQMGVTMRRFLAHLKIQHAFYQWKPGMQYADLAVAAGFYDQPHFLRTARDMFDAMPSAISAEGQLKIVRV